MTEAVLDESTREDWKQALISLGEKVRERREERERKRDSAPWFGNYAYVCTRCRARRAKLYGPETYERLMRMGLSEIARFMQESTYRDEIDRMGTRFHGVDLIEYALNDNLARTYREVLSWCWGKPRYLLAGYLKRWDVFNLKTILRSRFSDTPAEEVRTELIVAGELGEEDLVPLLEHETIPEIVETLAGTEWYGPLAATLEETDQTEAVEGLTEIENALDRHYYRQLVERIPSRGRANKRYAAFIREEIDLVNLRTILRLNRDGYEAADIEPLILDGGEDLTGELLTDLMAETDLAGTAQVLRGTAIGERIGPRLGDMVDRGDIHEVVGELERVHQRSAGRGKKRYPLSMLPIMDFVMAKKTEIDTIRIIARGKEHQLPQETIQREVVASS